MTQDINKSEEVTTQDFNRHVMIAFLLAALCFLLTSMPYFKDETDKALYFGFHVLAWCWYGAYILQSLRVVAMMMPDDEKEEG